MSETDTIWLLIAVLIGVPVFASLLFAAVTLLGPWVTAFAEISEAKAKLKAKAWKARQLERLTDDSMKANHYLRASSKDLP